MTERSGTIRDMTLGEVIAGARRYQPFILTVIAIVLIVTLLPGKPTTTNSALSGTNSSTDTGGAGTGPQAAGVGPGGTSTGGTSITGGSGGGRGGNGPNAGGAVSSVPVPSLSSVTDKFCDRATGRQAVPSLFATPCMPAFNGDNGGSTYNGVTKDTITVAVPYDQSSATTTAALAQDPDTETEIRQTRTDYNNLFMHHFQTYGRKVKIVYFNSTYNSGDSAAQKDAECQADANTTIYQIKAFASLGDCGTTAYDDTLVKKGILCFCTTTIPASNYLNWAPYVWGNGLPDEEAGYLMRAEMVCNEINPFPPTHAGEADLNSPIVKKRSFGLVWPGPSTLDETTVYEAGAKYFANLLKQCGTSLLSSDSFPIIDTNGPDDARKLMAKYKSLKITDVIVVQDPIDPKFLTAGATANNYFPEWIVTGSALTDETFFARQYDTEQWNHAFGMGLLGDRVDPKLTDAYAMYFWEYKKTPPAPTTYTLEYPFFLWFYSGVQLAGPNLTAQTFQCGEPPYTSHTHSGDRSEKAPGKPCVGKTYPGIFGYPISPTHWQQRVANNVITWGDHLWPWDDYNMFDDAVLLYWDPSAQGPDETGKTGAGMYRFINGGKRYMWHSFPKGNQPWFNTANTVTVFNTLPAGDKPPSYGYKCYYLC